MAVLRTFAPKVALMAALMVALAASTHSAAAQQPDAPSIVGTWKLTANYDLFADGRRRNTWGDDPQGLLILTSNGLFSVQLMGGSRAPRPGSVPTDPVGPAIAYYGRYTLDGTKGFSVKIEQSTFPQWNGTTNVRTITALSASKLAVVATPIKDPQGGEFVPHLEFERIP